MQSNYDKQQEEKKQNEDEEKLQFRQSMREQQNDEDVPLIGTHRIYLMSPFKSNQTTVRIHEISDGIYLYLYLLRINIVIFMYFIIR